MRSGVAARRHKCPGVWQRTDVVWCIAAMLMLDDACYESAALFQRMLLVCKSVTVVLRDPFFVATVYLPWLKPYHVLLCVPYMPMHRILEAVDAHTAHSGLLVTAFIALVELFQHSGYHMPDAYACDFVVRVLADAMAAHPTSPVVLHLACLVLAWHCTANERLYAQVAASGVLALAVEAEYKYCAMETGSYPGFQTLLKSVQYHTDTQIHVARARAGRLPPAYVGYHVCA